MGNDAPYGSESMTEAQKHDYEKAFFKNHTPIGNILPRIPQITSWAKLSAAFEKFPINTIAKFAILGGF